MDHKQFEQVIKTQDELIAGLGMDIWVGMEPTFTLRFAESSEWLSEPLGSEKLDYAHKLIRELHQRQPGGVVLHTLGRQYASEDLPRWSIGYYKSRENPFD